MNPILKVKFSYCCTHKTNRCESGKQKLVWKPAESKLVQICLSILLVWYADFNSFWIQCSKCSCLKYFMLPKNTNYVFLLLLVPIDSNARCSVSHCRWLGFQWSTQLYSRSAILQEWSLFFPLYFFSTVAFTRRYKHALCSALHKHWSWWRWHRIMMTSKILLLAL